MKLQLSKSQCLALLSLLAITIAFQLQFCLPARAGYDTSPRLLNRGWQFRAIMPAEKQKGHEEACKWHNATVPGSVQTDLLNNSLIPDPFYGDNEQKLQWIGLSDWECRTQFSLSDYDIGFKHLDLKFAGLDTFATVYINDRKILTADNMFRHYKLDIKPYARQGANELKVIFQTPVTKMLPLVKTMPYHLPTVGQVLAVSEEGVATDPYTRKAAYQFGWDWGPRFITQGIWQGVELDYWNDFRFDDIHICQRQVSSKAAELEAEILVRADHPCDVEIRVDANLVGAWTEARLAQHGNEPHTIREVALTAGVNRLTVPIHIDNPALWYPNGYGNQARYNFLAYFDKPVSAIQTTTGLRKVQLRRQADQYGKSFEFIINDIPVFAKGANVIPFDSFPERVTPETHRKILEAARDAHMNMVRAWGGGYYESDDFYDICDELGLMVWQEFMFGGAMVPGDTAFSDNVKIEAEQQVQRLRNHSCIVLWCGNNEVETGWRHWGDRLQFQKTLTAEQREHVWQSYLHIFNDILKGTVETMADSTPYWPSSPSANYEEDPDNQHNGDMHYWSVWHALEPIEKYNDITPRFMSEFGFQSFPEMSTIKSFAGPDDLRIDSPVMLAHQKNSGGNERIRTYMLRQYREPKDFASFVYLSQVQQAEAIKTCAEHLRRSRPKTMGSLYWQLNDCWPVASWSSIDYLGRWKALHYYVRRFYNDLLISPCRQAGAVETTVVSDKQEPVKAAIRIRLMDFFGKCLNERKKDLVISGAGSQIVDTVPEKELLAGQSPENVFVLCELSVADKVESKNLLFFSPAKSLNLPAQIVKHNFRLGPNGVLMTFSSDVLARDVYVSFGDLDARLPDNFFDLLPGQSVEFEIKTLADLEELEKSLSILTLANYK